ncbi:MAG: autotransporter domain-containing protein [Asticcacaulis sp.]
MRKSHLFNATALGLITASGLAFTAQAETSISTARTTPALTATINEGNADDIKVATAGSITLESGTALTVNSNHKAVLEGTITIAKPADNATGILIDGARTTDITLTGGTISITDDYTATDTDTPADGLIDGDFAKGTNRYGIRATGHVTGDIAINNTSTASARIIVEGNQSAGISIEDGQTGDFTFDGSIAITGTDVTGIRLAGEQTGQTYISGSITSQGPNASGFELTGNQNGALIIDSSIGNSGYRYPAGVSTDLIEKLDPAEHLQQGKSAVIIAGDVTDGILIGGAVTSTDEANTDENGNGLTDTTETTAAIIQYGSAPALLIGSDSRDITIGAVKYNSSATDAYKNQTYGLVNRGSISAGGVYSGMSATALQVGGLGHDVTLENGIFTSGAISATALDAEARGVALLDGTIADKFINAGTIAGNVSSAEGVHNANGLLIGSGAQLPEIENSGSISAQAAGANVKAYAVYLSSGSQVSTINNSGAIAVQSTGKDVEAVAIYDASNSLTSLTNTRTISAAISGGTDADGNAQTATNRPIAIDTRNNTVGLNLVQNDTSTEEVSNIPYIAGDILLGSGNDTITVNGGYVLGTIDFGAGQNSLTIDEGGRVGGLLKTTGSIDLDIIDGRLELGRGTLANLSALNVSSDGALRFNLNSETPTQAILTSSGAATIASGATIELGFDKIVKNSTRYTLLSASNISFGTVDADSFDQTLPYLYKASLATNTGNTELYADVRLRTQAESGLSVSEYGAFDAVLTAAQGSTAATNALLAPATEAAFLKSYMSFLPDFSGENILTLAKGNEALSRTLFAQSVVPSAGETQYWLQEYGYEITRDRGDTAGFESRGFSFAGGVERGLSSTQAVGLFLGYTAASPTDSFATPEEDLSATDLSLGLYWRVDNGQGFKGWVRGGVGRASFESDRYILETNFVAHSESKWNGVSYNGSVGASYEYTAGFLTLTPSVSADYYGLKEDARDETGGGSAFDLSIEERTSHLFSGTALLNIGRAKKDALFKPEVWVGYRNNFSAELADTVASFEGGNPFTLTGGEVEGGGPVAGVRIAASNQYSYFGIEAEYEKQDAYENKSLAIRVRFQF